MMRKVGPYAVGDEYGEDMAAMVAAMSSDPWDWPYLAKIITGLPKKMQGRAVKEYGKRRKAKGQQVANTWIREAVSQKLAGDALSLASSDDEIAEYAKARAEDVRNKLAEWVPADSETVERKLRQYADAYRASLPEDAAIRGIVARLTDEAFWRRNVRRVQGREVESSAIQLGMVHKFAGIYASDETVARVEQQARRNRAALEATEAENTATGEVFTLAELADLGVSNPSVRFAELMVRVRGMEAFAREHGHVGIFATGTCPSRMHARRSESGETNDLFDGTIPREAQSWMARAWGRNRSALERAGIRFYGVRVAEPHHDGTPHWHMLVFMAPLLEGGRSAVARFKAIFRRYLLRGDWKAPKAKDIKAELRAKGWTHRAATMAAGQAVQSVKVQQRAAEKADTARLRRACDFKEIDWSQGSAAGYLVKYLAKNISGERCGEDLENGKPATETAGRVRAWASVWGIRQFQIVGGPTVGVWRELRRLKEKPQQMELFGAWNAASEAKDWAAFIQAQGGMEIRRADRPVQLWKLEEPGRLTKYAEPAGDRVAGVKCQGVATATRSATWEIRSGNGQENSFAGCKKKPVLCVVFQPNARQGLFSGDVGADALRLEVGLGFSGTAAPAPWTRVNNCTEGTHEPAKKDGSGGGRRRKQVADSAAAHQGHGGAVRRADLGGVESHQRGTAQPGWWEISF